jgi:chromate reductase, NAD(P)H dehydrogenase (quinone)
MKYKIFAICGSTRSDSSNLRLLKKIGNLLPPEVSYEIFTEAAEIPHFIPDLASEGTPQVVIDLRKKIDDADGIIICTPEYVFSLPAVIKNILEWMVATVIFERKPVASITAAAGGEKAHESLLLILKTIGADLREDGQVLIQGVKSKVNVEGEITDAQTLVNVKRLVEELMLQIRSKRG